MRITTPRATPVAAAPVRSLVPTPLGELPPELRGPTLVVWADGEYRLTNGSLLIGRSHECELRLEDALVSRLHARVRVETDRVGIEDLHSTNGIYLRGDRVLRFAVLREGDRVQLGTQEISFFALREELAPESGVGERELTTLEVAPGAALPADGVANAIPTTTRAAALTMVGNLARRFAREGRAEEGARLLIPHLKRILRGATSGLEVPPALCEQASTYAMDVAVWTADAAWLDYIVELHVVAEQLMTHSAILALQRAERWLGAVDRLLLQYYIETCAARGPLLDENEQLRLRLLERLLVAEF
jgi:pSer/pThr/pTyr-binding forkhead associated (FHA) protein